MSARERWNQRYADRPDMGGPSLFVREVAELLPADATIVDLAGGTGRHALWLAGRGHEVTLIDISSVALDVAATTAREAGVALETIEWDLETDGVPPGRRWDGALMHYFFDAAVVRAAWRALAPGGVLALAQPTVMNLERHERPSRRFLLEVGEVRRLADELAAAAALDGASLDVVMCTERWQDNDRHEGRLVVRRAIGNSGTEATDGRAGCP